MHCNDFQFGAGLMTDVGGTIERPRDFATRQELATSLAATIKT